MTTATKTWTQGEVMQRTCSGCHKSEFVTASPPLPWAKNKPPRPWYCARCQHKANPHYQRIKALDLDVKSLIQAARDSCGLAMRNTATGAWLAAALDQLASEHQNACGRQH